MSTVDDSAGLSINDLPLSEDRSRAWRILREAGDVVVSGNEFLLASAEACEFAAKRPEIFSSARAFDLLGSPVPVVPIAIDPPDHSRFRRILDPFFGPRKMSEREPELRKQVGELIDAIKRKGSCDFMAELAVPFPSQVFLTLFGLPLEDRDKLVQWKDSIIGFTDAANFTPTPEGLAQALELYTYLSEHIAQRRRDTGDADLLSDLISLPTEDGLTDAEILGLCFLFVLAGLDTVTAALGFAFAHLAADPELRRRIREDNSLIPNFIEEQLRVEVPVPFVPRVTNEDVEVAGVHLPKDSNVLVVYGCANRDPRRYQNPDTMNIDKQQPHFTFGRGPHRCLGSHLARVELRIVLEEWHNRIPEYGLADGAHPMPPWPNGTLGLDNLPLIVA